MTQEIRATSYDGGPLDGLVTTHPVSSHGLDKIHALLANGRNVKLVLVKDDGSRVEYELSR